MTTKKLKWKNLLADKCPKCGGPFELLVQQEIFTCSILCGFTMKKRSVERTIAKINKTTLVQEDFDFFDDDSMGALALGDDKMLNYEEDEEFPDEVPTPREDDEEDEDDEEEEDEEL